MSRSQYWEKQYKLKESLENICDWKESVDIILKKNKMLSYVICLPFREFLLYFHKVKVEFNRMGGIRLAEKLQSNCLVYLIDSCIKEKVERLQPYKYFTKSKQWLEGNPSSQHEISLLCFPSPKTALKLCSFNYTSC